MLFAQLSGRVLCDMPFSRPETRCISVRLCRGLNEGYRAGVLNSTCTVVRLGYDTDSRTSTSRPIKGLMS